MPTRNSAPLGSPCWTDLWTSDVEGSRSFYSGLFGWEAQEPSPEFGGYFMFTREGAPIAGGMGDMGDMRADNTWKIYLSTDDLAEDGRRGRGRGRPDRLPPDGCRRPRPPDGARRPDGGGPRCLAARNVSGLHGLERARRPELVRAANAGLRRGGHLLSRGFPLGHERRRRHRRVPLHDDARPEWRGASWRGSWTRPSFLPEGVAAHWSVYWKVDDADAAAAKAKALGGSVVAAPESTPYGRLATLTDPAGARFKLRAPNP